MSPMNKPMLLATVMLLLVHMDIANAAGVCDKCNVPVSSGGCKCDTNCNCVGVTTNPCAKCNLPTSSGGCKCDNNCACLQTPSPSGKNPTPSGKTPTPPPPPAGVCTKCNIAVSAGGCKCDSNCACLVAPAPSSRTPSPSKNVVPSGTVIESGTVVGSFYYDINNNACQGQPLTSNGVTTCESNTSGPNQQTQAQRGTNNMIAIGELFGDDSGARAKYCGKQVIVTYKGVRITAPDGGDFFVWDGCEACYDKVDGGRIDFSASGLRRVDSNACFDGVVSGVSYQITTTQVMRFVD